MTSEAVRGTAASNDGVAATTGATDETVSEGHARALAAIASLNQEFRLRTDSLMSVPLAVLVEQRDRAVLALGETELMLETQRAELQAEQDGFIASLMEDHQRDLAALEQQLAQAKLNLERQAVLAPVIHSPLATGGDSELRTSLERAEEHIATLRQQLENAYREVDESRSDGWRLQEIGGEGTLRYADRVVEKCFEVEIAFDAQMLA